MNDPKLHLRISLGDDTAIGYVTTQIRATDLELPFEEFCARYLKPAFEQAKREMEYVKPFKSA